jgi:hypothetical protein
MTIPPPSGPRSVRDALDAIVQEYRQTGDVPRLLERVMRLARESPTDEIVSAADAHRELHEVAGPIFEVVVEREPHHVRALIGLANAYWLTGRGPDVVGALASRAIAADPGARAGWHLWALTEPTPRGRTTRWQQVADRFPDDLLAKVNLADNAAALAGAEDDPVALKTAIGTYEALLAVATQPAQRIALEQALDALRAPRG